MGNPENPEQEIKVPNLEIPEKRQKGKTSKTFNLERMREDLKSDEQETKRQGKESSEIEALKRGILEESNKGKTREGISEKPIKGEKNKNQIEKDLRKKAIKGGVEVGWDRLSDKEREQYENADGEPDIEKYAEELEEKREEVNELLEKDDIFLSEDVFYEMISRGYKPEKIYIEELTLKVLNTALDGLMGAGAGGLLAGSSVLAGMSFSPILAYGAVLAGSAIGTLIGQVLRADSEIQIPLASSGKLKLSKKDFKNLVSIITIEVEKSTAKETQRMKNNN